MTEITASLVHDLVADLPRPPSPRVSPDDLAVATAPTPQPRVRQWQRPLADLLGAAVTVLGVQAALTTVWSPHFLLVACWPVLLAATGCYAQRPIEEPLSDRAGRVLRAGAILGLASWMAFPLVGAVAAPDVLIPLVVAVTVAGLILTALPRPARPRPRLVVAGSREHVGQAVAELTSVGSYEVAAVCVPEAGEDDGTAQPLAGAQVHVGVSRAIDVAHCSGADAVVILPGDELPTAVLRRLQWQAPGASVDVYVGTGLLDVSTARMSVVQGVGLDLIHVRPAALSGPRRLAKDMAERTAAAIGLLFLLPALVVISMMIRTTSRGPALFRQTRVGHEGRIFTMYKFRTMSALAEAQRDDLADDNDCDDVLFKLRNDPRITRVGAWLRRYSVDELPQLWNVVRGDMSLVGPRPALPAEVEAYDLDPRRRLAVRPGLTGLWQVSGRSDLTWAESVRLDVRYVDNWSIALDLSILRRTVGAVLGHRGAY